MNDDDVYRLIEMGIDPDQDEADILKAMADKVKSAAKACEIEFDLPHPNYWQQN